MDRKVYIVGKDPVPEKLTLGAGESFFATFVVEEGVSADVTMEVDLVGEGASLDLGGVYRCSGDERVAFHLNVRHLCGGCTSRQLFKGIVGGRSRVVFDGLIHVAPDAQKTEAYQENHSILLSAEAQVQTSPQLEIYADDVVCSHGATIGSLSEDELFYMRSRGIPEAEARQMQIQSFLSPVLVRLQESSRM
ncbi:MAG: SufD family Fe-S cluster assembly protein [Candidatus Cryptobacteroides sp.]